MKEGENCNTLKARSKKTERALFFCCVYKKNLSSCQKKFELLRKSSSCAYKNLALAYLDTLACIHALAYASVSLHTLMFTVHVKL